jgi:hypothetical protein
MILLHLPLTVVVVSLTRYLVYLLDFDHANGSDYSQSLQYPNFQTASLSKMLVCEDRLVSCRVLQLNVRANSGESLTTVLK